MLRLRDGFWCTGDEDLAAATAASGPRSTIQSAVLITSRLCSIPRWYCPDRAVYAVRRAVAEYGEVQAGGRLIKNIQCLPGAGFDSSRASFTRWASPPESVVRTAPGECTSDQRPSTFAAYAQCRYGIKELTRLFDGHIQHSWMVLPLYLISSVSRL